MEAKCFQNLQNPDHWMTAKKKKMGDKTDISSQSELREVRMVRELKKLPNTELVKFLKL